jgi:hypothetical protein
MQKSHRTNKEPILELPDDLDNKYPRIKQLSGKQVEKLYKLSKPRHSTFMDEPDFDDDKQDTTDHHHHRRRPSID